VGSDRKATGGLKVERLFSTAGVHPFDQIEWEKRSAAIKDSDGRIIFRQDDAEVPAAWSQLATNVVVSKYFYGAQGGSERESSVRQLIDRVTRTIADWVAADGVLASPADAQVFYDELTWLCVNQYGSFNSPAWFNVGLFQAHGVEGSPGSFHWDKAANAAARTQKGYEYPQASACFIQSVRDDMESIMDLAKAEAMLFKFGSGTGTDLSTLRSSREKLAGGGTPSGPLSFMRVYDQVAAVVKSGGKTRRAAKMQSLRCDHPDIKEFIEAKSREEKKAWALIEQGYDGNYNGEAYASILFQNANLSIRVTDEFMQAAQADQLWQTREITTGKPSTQYRAKELLDLIAEGTRICGDPGVQYHSTINRWHTCPAAGTINASNPCSEYMFLDDSACNLASLNLMKFRQADGGFNVAAFRHAVRLFIIAQETLVDHASYPTEPICRNSHTYRPLGLGYANLGSLLMSLGLPYDSNAGRALAAAITAILTGAAYATSAELASRLSPFDGCTANRDSMLHVMDMHREAVEHIDAACPPAMLAAARQAWEEALAAGSQLGYRNAQVSVLAPTGTIGFMMDCDTTGIEPDIALVKYKLLAGGGMFKIVNRTVAQALRQLGYDEAAIKNVLAYVEAHDMIEGAPLLREEHLPVFDCAFKPAAGQRSINYMGHVRMMAAVQPFISGAISKTVNMPKESTAADIRDVYVQGWKLGLKAIAIYRDGSKRSQPVSTKKDDKSSAAQQEPATAQAQALLEEAMRRPHRRHLPDTRQSLTHKFDIAGHEGYITVGLFDDGAPGEVFITMAKEGSTVGGMMDAFATAISLCLQYGVPLESLVKKFSHQRFEPNGMTTNRDIPFAKSIVDYIFRWLGLRFLDGYRKSNLPHRPAAGGANPSSAAPESVTEDGTSDPSRAGEASDTEVHRPVGDILSPPDAGGNGEAAKAAPLARAARIRKTSTLARAGRIDQQFTHFQEDAPPCDYCGSITVRNGNCYKCYTCGNSLGCS
jgi:ribonucleoside-diphosphate reductase alpha chain